MDTTTKLKQFALLGIACMVCIAIVKIARYDQGEAYQSIGQIQNSGEGFVAVDPNGEPESRQPGELQIAHRIPTVNDADQEYPVQLAAFDSVQWNSDVVTPNRVSTPSDHENNSPAMKVPSASDSSFSIQKQGTSDPGSTIQVNQKSENAFAPKTALPQVITEKSKPHASGKRIVGMTRHQPSREQLNEGNSQSAATTTTPDSQDRNPLAKISFKPPTTIGVKSSTKRIVGIDESSSQKTPPAQTQDSPSQQVDNNGNSKRAILVNPYFHSDAQNKQTAATDSTPRPNADPSLNIWNNTDSDETVPDSVNTSTDFNTPISTTSNDSENSLPTRSEAFEASQPANSKLNEQALPNRLESKPAPSSRQLVTNTSPVSRPTITNDNNQFAPNIGSTAKPSTNVTISTPRNRGSETPSQPAPSKPSVNLKTPGVLLGSDTFVLAEQPKFGDHWNDDRPVTDHRAHLVTAINDDFSPDPIDPAMPYDAYQQIDVYEGKTLNANQRPLVELGRPWYQLGQLSPGYSWLGKHNNVAPQFLVYGDVRSAIASNTQNGDNVSRTAIEVNLDFDLKLTSTERFHMFVAPLDDGQSNAGWLLDEGEWVDQYDANIDFGYFEGDLGAIVGGFTDKTLPFDLPIAMGIMPLVLQNGVWMEDAFLGIAATIPARNSPRLNISNMDLTFFAGFDQINSPAFATDDSASKMYGFASFIDALNGYFEIDYAYLEDRTFDDRSYHNLGFGYSRRFGRLFSHSSRIIVNAGQSTDVVENTADGVLLLSENSLITGSPSTVVPYLNLFAGFDRPQSAARAIQAGGVLRNTGILFETDGMTNYPTLDPTANDTYGGAFGLNLLASDFSQQLVVELAAMGVMGEDANRNAAGGQYGLGFRYQLPLTNAVIFRADGMYGFLEDQQDVRGLRFELRHKY